MRPGPSSQPFLQTAGRRVAIDVIRGFAILWVILYHLWTDLRYPNVYPAQSDAFRAVPHRIADGNLAGTATAISDAFFRVGYLGVPLFMMLSGLSLTLVALGRETPRGTLLFLSRRLRRVMLPYWAGFAITLAFAVALALVQWQRHGGDTYLHYLQSGDINVDGGQLVAGALLIPRIFRDEWQFAPEGSLWFVLVVVQYCVLFPPLLWAMRRAGPWPVLTGALAVTVASLAAMVAVNGDLVDHRGWIEMAAPFRVFEFVTGMAIGYLIVGRPQSFVRLTSVVATSAAIVGGAAIFIAGCMIDLDAGALSALQPALIVTGFALIFTPLIARTPSHAKIALPARGLAWIGVISYTVLIINEPLRSITHTMSAERASDGALLAWAIAIVPLTLVLARPLAIVLGLVDRALPAAAVDAGITQDEPREPAPLHR